MLSLRRTFAPLRIARNVVTRSKGDFWEGKFKGRWLPKESPGDRYSVSPVDEFDSNLRYADESKAVCHYEWPETLHIDLPERERTRKTAMWEEIFAENRMLLCWQLPAMNMQREAELRYSFFEVGMDLHKGNKKDLFPFLLKSKHRHMSRLVQSTFAISFSKGVEIKQSLKFAKAFPGVELTGGCIDDQLLTREQIIALSKAPPLETLHSELVGVLSSPAYLLSAYLQKHVDTRHP